MSKGKSILLIDDQLSDLIMMQRGVEVCLRLLGPSNQFSIVLAKSSDEALNIVSKQVPALIVTDLFMPKGDFSELAVQCDEMEFPEGLHLLSQLNETGFKGKTVVTTFFWDYPGFGRYREIFSSLEVDRIVPKDLWYLAGCLGKGSLNSIKEAGTFTPIRILLETVYEALNPSSDLPLSKEMNYLKGESLFEESCAWLFANSHLALEARKHGAAHNAETWKPWAESEEINQYGLISPWMPAFILECPRVTQPSGRDLYRTLMEDLEGDGWAVHMQPTKAVKLTPLPKVKHVVELDEKKAQLEYEPHVVDTPSIEKFLNPRKHRHYAQLLLTLSFFSYWCHLPDHRASRTVSDLAQIIETRTGRHYRQGIIDRKKVTEQLSDDLESLSLMVLDAIRTEYRNDWWRHFSRHYSVGIIEKVRDKRGAQYRYWLNASVLLRMRGETK